jgi:hypothetical protein
MARTVTSWFVVATRDNVINPDLALLREAHECTPNELTPEEDFFVGTFAGTDPAERVDYRQQREAVLVAAGVALSLRTRRTAQRLFASRLMPSRR